MVKIIGNAYRITRTKVIIKKLNYEEFLNAEYELSDLYDGRSPEEIFYFFYSPEIELKYSDDVVDDLIKYAGKRFCEIEVERGVVLSIKPFKTQNEIIEKYTRIPRQKANQKLLESLSGKLRIVLEALIEMERETGMVEKSRLLARIETEQGIQSAEAERLLGQLLRDGTVYSPREGYFKKT